jgi:hypothetical protein
MKEMTTAEFAKANLAALEEPVRVRRYTKTVGVYYPEGFEPASAPQPAQVTLEEVAPSSVEATQKIVEDLTQEVARLKRELAARPFVTPSRPPSLPTDAVGKVVSVPRRDDDPFAGLAKQDREFFERKLGKKK